MKQQKSPGWLKQKMRTQSSSFSISIEMVIISLHNTTSTTDHFLSINSSRLKRQRQIITKTPHNVIHFLVKLTLLPHIGDEYACGILSFLKLSPLSCPLYCQSYCWCIFSLHRLAHNQSNLTENFAFFAGETLN